MIQPLLFELPQTQTSTQGSVHTHKHNFLLEVNNKTDSQQTDSTMNTTVLRVKWLNAKLAYLKISMTGY